MCVINFRISSLASLSPFDRGRFLGQIAALPMNKFAPSLISKQPPLLLLLLPSSPGPPTISASLRQQLTVERFTVLSNFTDPLETVFLQNCNAEGACVRARVY